MCRRGLAAGQTAPESINYMGTLTRGIMFCLANEANVAYCAVEVSITAKSSSPSILSILWTWHLMVSARTTMVSYWVYISLCLSQRVTCNSCARTLISRLHHIRQRPFLVFWNLDYGTQLWHHCLWIRTTWQVICHTCGCHGDIKRQQCLRGLALYPILHSATAHGWKNLVKSWCCFFFFVFF